jgi:hypothetical protein
MQTKDSVVRLEVMDGVWEVCGVDRDRGVVPENMVLSANSWGSDQAAFDLRRDPKRLWPDVRAFTPVTVDVGGRRVWSGRVKETPSKDGADRVMSVTCEGWQYHLDDGAYERVYIHNKVGDWKDARSVLGSNLTRFTTIGRVQADGAITIGWANGDTVPTNALVGVTLDLGAPYARAVSLDFERLNGGAAESLWCVGHNAPDGLGTTNGFFSTGGLNAEPATGTYVGVASAPQRYVTVYLNHNAAGGVFGSDVTERLKAIRVYGDDTYRSAGLKAPTVIRDALDQATSLLSPDRSRIDPGGTITLNLPSFATGRPVTPREAWTSANSYHNYKSQVDVYARPVFEPLSTRPRFAVGAWSAMQVEDSSANSSDDIYNNALVTGQSPAGSPVRALRTAANLGYSTLPDRRGFNRTMILDANVPLPDDLVIAAALGDAWLRGHAVTPFKGTIRLTGDRAVRERTSGADVPLEALLLNTSELLHFSDRPHPDTAGWGRDARMTQVSYDVSKNEATVTLDNTRADFQALLARLAVVTGS